MVASIIILLFTICSLGQQTWAEKALFHETSEIYYWPDRKVNIYIADDAETTKHLREIKYAIQYWSSWTCLEFNLLTEEPSGDAGVMNSITIAFSETEGCVPDQHEKMKYKIRRFAFFGKPCQAINFLIINLGVQLGFGLDLSAIAPYGKPTFADLRTINNAYKCYEKCIFKPKCTNGGYIDPKGPKGCAFCMCPEGKTCQDVKKPLEPNNEHEIMKAGTTATFVESTKSVVETMFDKVKPDLTNVKPGDLFDKVSDIKKGAIGAGVGTAMVDLMTGQAENIPEDVTAAVAESLICSKLEKVFEKAITGGSLAAGFASAAVAIVQKLKAGDVAGALKAGISKGFGTYIGTAIGTFLGTAIGGPFGTFIGAVLGAMLGEAISYLISELLDFLTPFFEAAWTWIKEGVKTVVYYVIVKPILFLGEYLASLFG